MGMGEDPLRAEETSSNWRQREGGSHRREEDTNRSMQQKPKMEQGLEPEAELDQEEEQQQELEPE